MKDPRIATLAKNLIRYSVHLEKGEKVLIENFGQEKELVQALVKEAYTVGALPYVWLKDHSVDRSLLMGATTEQFQLLADFENNVMKQMDAYIGIRGGNNASQLSDVPLDKMQINDQTVWEQVHGQTRVNHTKWVVLRYPTDAMAQLAKMSTEAFEDFYFNVCNLDYSKMDKAMDSLSALLSRTDQVRIVGQETDLSFSIKNIPNVKCAGNCNIPDGEIYTAPIKNSVNGVITYNAASPYRGFTFENVQFTFENGKIVKATANDSQRLNEILDSDEGARYIGEFAIGVNPYIKDPMGDTLFDEKIDGSIHFTPGQAYEEADNGNRSVIHWDLVYIQRPEFGGGEIYFDDVLVRKDGRFVLPELDALNPENLK